jgi:regulator of protease activity HflC (stomatin/prohibitin superfamily)
MEENNVKLQSVKEKQIIARSGWALLVGFIILSILMLAALIFGINKEYEFSTPVLISAWVVLVSLISAALKVIQPNEALVLVLFGKYYGTLSQPGFYMVNPFTNKKKVSLKARTLNNDKQKVNDEDGNPIEIGVVVVWRVADTALSSFNVENFMEFVSTQTDSSIRNVARQYPYDLSAAGDNELSLRGSSEEVSKVLKTELQQRVDIAGIEIMEARISHLAYAPEIAAAMLQRQQAAAIIAARQMIVEGAVGMVQMALDKLAENKVIELDEERKAQMVSNLLVVLCGDKASQPVINTSSIY